MKSGVQTKEEIFTELCRSHGRISALGVTKLGLFGSFARCHQSPESDVDLLVEFEQGQKTFDNFIRLALLLEDLLPRRVELVTPEGLSPYVGPYVLGEVEYAALPA